MMQHVTLSLHINEKQAIVVIILNPLSVDIIVQMFVKCNFILKCRDNA